MFETASVKAVERSPANVSVRGMKGGPGTNDPGRIGYRAVTLQQLLMVAYGIEDYQIRGPGWLGTEIYDVSATLPPDTSKEQFALMLQGLVTNRFRLASHLERKELSVFDLVVAKNGPKLKESPAIVISDQQAPVNSGRTLSPGKMMVAPIGDAIHLMGRQVSITTLAAYLSKLAGRPVFDKTQLAGNFEIDLSIDGGGSPPVMASGDAAPVASSPAGEGLSRAVMSQLGLELRSRKGPVETFVVDSVEKMPTQN